MRRFYDTWGVERMVGYVLWGNRRIERAIERARPYVRPDSRILEIGCGIGMVAYALSVHCPRGHVKAIDLSPRLVELARFLHGRKNVTFEVGDILDPGMATRERSKTYDVIVMVDVIEHIPEERRETLIEMIGVMLQERGHAIVTFPSPEYQRWLMAHRPSELQLIDLVIEPFDLAREFERQGMALKHLSYEDVWMTNQYVHMVVQKGRPLENAPAERRSLGWRLWERTAGRWRHYRYRRALERFAAERISNGGEGSE